MQYIWFKLAGTCLVSVVQHPSRTTVTKTDLMEQTARHLDQITAHGYEKH